MSKISKLILLGFLTLFTVEKGKAQLSLATYQNNIQRKIALGYNVNDKLWTDLKITPPQRLILRDPYIFEFGINYNFIHKEDFSLYSGIGVSYYTQQDKAHLFVPLGLQVRPFENFRQLSFHTETQLEYDILGKGFEVPLIYWGFRYTFGKNTGN